MKLGENFAFGCSYFFHVTEIYVESWFSASKSRKTIKFYNESVMFLKRTQLLPKVQFVSKSMYWESVVTVHCSPKVYLATESSLTSSCSNVIFTLKWSLTGDFSSDLEILGQKVQNFAQNNHFENHVFSPKCTLLF